MPSFPAAHAAIIRLHWDEIAPAPALPSGECHIWSFALGQTEARQRHLAQSLSAEEIERAAAFLRPAPRHQFIVCRGTLRLLLAAYLARPPADCRFALDQFGKPSLLAPAANLRFNLSHSGEQALIAIARDFEVGVDIEIHRPAHDASGLARMIFAPPDLEAWLALPETARAAAFYRAWTAKEAVAKAIGCGLALDFPSLRVSFLPDHAPAILDIEPAWGAARDWRLATIPTSPGYSAAIAAATSELRLVHLTLSD